MANSNTNSNGSNIAWGKRLLPSIIDSVAAKLPQQVFATVSLTTDVTKGFRDITFKDIANAIDYTAHMLQRQYGPSKTFETLCYLGPPDLRTPILFYAAIKCGFKMLFPSPRNPASTNALLMKQTQCAKLLFPHEMAQMVGNLRAELSGLETFEIPPFQEMMDAKSDPFPYKKRFEDSVNNPIVVLHSSGSTGIPKPITMTHGTFATLDNDRNVPDVPGRKKHDFTLWDSICGKRFFTIFPPFHLAGFVSFAITPVYSGAIPVMAPPIPSSGEIVRQSMEQLDIRALFVPPVIAEQLLKENNGLTLFKNLEFLCCAGGALSQAAGDKIAQYTDICQYYGSTETFQIQQLVPKKDEWTYMEWHPDCDVEMQQRDAGGPEPVYEMVLKSRPGAVTTNAVFYTFPEISEFRTKDLFTQHSHKPQLWRYYGRDDDIIVFSTGEKFNPVPTEVQVSAHPLVSGAVVIGQGRAQALLLVEIKDGTPSQGSDSPVEEIWPVVQKANQAAAGQGRITKSHILTSKPEKPFPRAGKGTVIRKVTEKLYEDEITALYGRPTVAKGIPQLKPTFDTAAVNKFVSDTVKSAFADADISNEQNLLELGLDSIQSTQISGMLKSGLLPYQPEENLEWLTPAFLFAFPTIEHLTSSIAGCLSTGKAPDPRNRLRAMSDIIDKSLANLSNIPKPSYQAAKTNDDKTLLVTGTTGTLGSRLLLAAVKSESFSKIICLNRSSAAQSFHKTQLASLIPTVGLKTKVAYLTIDIQKPKLGLAESDYEQLLLETNTIVHNAWSTNHVLPLAAFSAHLAGMVELVKMAAQCFQTPRFFFVSSIAATAHWTATQGPVPESVPQTHKVASSSGYGESKRIAECILQSAARNAGFPFTVLRLGQVAGSTEASDPIWPITDWFPILLKSSRELGCVPEDFPDLDFVPSNLMAQAMVEIIVADDIHQDFEVLNLVNPNLTSWDSLKGVVRQFCGLDTKFVPMAEWLSRLKERADTEVSANRLPALKLLSFFEEIAQHRKGLRYETARTVARSKTLEEIPAINSDMMRLWLEQWQS
ncbi:MAG: putative NRPS-like protein biosynthetic cluster [Bogoriella megaspora]|nr:MAG: putative NRPS-like protein biosynthetic cluster [Bogoriella megaspora]